MKVSGEFESYYQSVLIPALNSLEPERKKTVNAFFNGLLSLLLFIPVIIIFVALKNPLWLLLGIAPLILSIKNFSVYSSIRANYVLQFKELIISRMVESVDQNLSYFHQSQISQLEYVQSDLFRNSIDSFTGGDLIEGKIEKTVLKFSELHHQEKRESVDSKGNRRTYWVTIFRGIFFIADFNKNFNGRTYVLPESGFDFLGLGKMLENWFSNRGEPVTLEDPVFEKYFKVFSDDQVEARYILSTSVIGRITAFREKAGSKLYLSFLDSKIFIALPVSKNLFEPKIFSSGVKADYLREYFHYLKLVTGIVEDLNLNRRIWAKQ